METLTKAHIKFAKDNTRLERFWKSSSWGKEDSGGIWFTIGDKKVLVDEEDFIKLVRPHPWRIFGGYVYRYVLGEGRNVCLHRVISKCADNLEVDHINHNPLDNRRVNLRCVSHQVNCNNQKPGRKKHRRRSSNLFTGIYRMPGSSFYWYRWTENGKRLALSLKTDDLPTAVKKVEDLKSGREVARWEASRQAEQTVATKIVESYLVKCQARNKKPMRARTASKQGAVLLKFLKDTSTSDVRQITPQTLHAWVEMLGKGGASKDTLHTYARVVVTFAKAVTHATGFEIPEREACGRKNWVRLEEVNRLIDQAPTDELRFILLAGFKAGLRKSEIIAARVGWFDLEAGLLHVQNDPSSGFILKDRENRTIPLSKAFQKFLTGYLASRDVDSYVLRPDISGLGKGEYRTDFKRAVYSHFKKYGIESSIHDMRRSYASNLVTRGESIYKVARWLGDGVQVVERSYGHLAPADRGVDVLDG